MRLRCIAPHIIHPLPFAYEKINNLAQFILALLPEERRVLFAGLQRQPLAGTAIMWHERVVARAMTAA